LAVVPVCAGGGFALVGIAWLVPVFGFHFAWRLAQEAPGPGARRLIGVPLVGLALTIGAVLLGARVLHLGREVVFLVGIAAGLVVSVLAYRAWPRLGRALLAYGLAARLPVILVMLVAILDNWGTHYDVPPPGGFPEMSPLAKWLQIGVVPQLLIWIPFTMVIGALFGGLALLGPGRKQRPASA
jgi:hypothetical protein